MNILVMKNKEEASKKAFDLLLADINNGAKVLGLATGSSPVGLYDQIVSSSLDCSHLISINLDEYVGIKPTDPQSYHFFHAAASFQPKTVCEELYPRWQ